MTPIYEKQNFIAGNVYYKLTHHRACTEVRNKITNAVNIIKTFLAISLSKMCVRGTAENSPAESRFTRHAVCRALDWKLSTAEVRGATVHVYLYAARHHGCVNCHRKYQTGSRMCACIKTVVQG